MNARLSRVSLIALVAMAPWAPLAQAQTACTPATPADGDSVTCAADGAGILDDGLDDLTIAVTGTVTATDAQAFLVDDGLTLTNSGTIAASADHAVEADNDAVIDTSGTITTDSGDGLHLGNDAQVTNSGTISAEDEAIQLDDDGQITNSGVLSGGDRAIDAVDGVTVVNAAQGVITGLGSDGIRLENGGTIRNAGTIEGADEAIQVEDDAVIENSGTLISADKGIQAANGAVITNTGTINAGTEGIETEDDAVIVNDGAIHALDDAINVGENARITNNGLLEVNGDQDGIDLDSGTVINNGTIISLGSEDGIDFDASTVAVSTIENHGLIEGAIGVNVELGTEEDPANTQAQVVINHGTIVGRSGLALQLGAGDDTLDVYSMDIQGAIDLGEGADTLIVRSTVTNGTLTFVSDPEVVDLSEAPDTAVYGLNTLAVASAVPFADMDALVAREGLTLGKPLLDMAVGTGWWGMGAASVFEGGSGRATLGRDFGNLGLFLSYGRTTRDGSDGVHDLTSDALIAGLRYGRDVAGGRVSAMAYAGAGEVEMESAATASGKGTTDRTVIGLAAGYHGAPMASGVRISARAGVEWQRFDAFSVTGLGGANFGERDALTGYLSAEVSRDYAMGGATVAPFLGVDLLFADGDDVAMTLGTGATTFATGGDSTMAQVTFGAQINGADAPWTLRVEGMVDEDGTAGAALSAGFRF